MGPLSIRLADDGETLLSKVVQERNLSPADLARESGLAKNTVHKLLRGDGALTLRTAQKITETLHRLAPREPDVSDLFDPASQTARPAMAIGGAR